MSADLADPIEPEPPATKARGRLDSLTLRRRTTGEAAAARAATTRRLRIILPVVGLLIIVGFLATTRTKVGDDAFLKDFADLNAEPEQMKMAKPRYAGVDARGNPYDITAESATQRTESGETVELDRPRAITSSEDAKTTVAAARGVLSTSTNVLSLEDDVTFEHKIGPDNYVLKTKSAVVSIEDENVLSDKGVEGTGPRGSTLKADRMRADNKAGRITFEGNVSMRIYPKPASDPSASEGGVQ
jgi:lipopolysaccharide export system protein LptC